MSNSLQWRINQHSGTRETHDLSHPFAQRRLVAMYFAILARTFPFAEGAAVKTCVCIMKQLFAFGAKNGILLFLSAVKTNHQLYCFLFLFNTRSLHVAAKIVNRS